ncbi:hypothetical protein [Demequina gelatinilytica]|uniref:hypothetical protein n=1 Tax=Demequina gelatinilytica TaxID=1638980 RepID=UPI0012E0C2D0|nr:hypothetical protein [Demequina gelatinilytica]
MSSWLAGELLAPEVPIVGGTYNEDESQEIPDSVSLNVPRRQDGFDWMPGADPRHPLAPNGQQLVVSIVVTSLLTRQSYETRLGVFQIQDFNPSDGDVQLTTAGMFKVIRGNKPAWQLAPRAGGTFASEIRRLVPGGIGVQIDPALTDRTVPTSTGYGSDRLAAINALAKAWPARVYADEYGQVRVVEAQPDIPVPVLEYVDGEGGTVVSAPTSGTRDGIYNRIKVNATDTDGSDQKPTLAIVEQTTGPFAVSTFGVETREWSSPFVTNATQALAAGTKMLRRSLRPARTLDVECLSDPRVQSADPVAVTYEGLREEGYVIAAQHPLTHRDGNTKLKVGLG